MIPRVSSPYLERRFHARNVDHGPRVRNLVLKRGVLHLIELGIGHGIYQKHDLARIGPAVEPAKLRSRHELAHLPLRGVVGFKTGVGEIAFAFSWT